MSIPSVNKARLVVESFFEETISVFWRSSECYGCDPRKIFEIPPGTNGSQEISTFYPSESFLHGKNKNLSCVLPNLGNQGEYLVSVAKNGTCTTEITREASNIYYPLVAAILIQTFLSFVYRFSKTIYAKVHQNSLSTDLDAQNLSGPSNSAESSEQLDAVRQSIQDRRRVKSLDTFRGLALFVMVFVNYGGGALWIFEHTPWNGLTIADLVFPWFIWIMGVSLAISLRSQRRKCVTTTKIFLKILSRTIKLFVIGLILNSMRNNDIQKLRIPGVLQRFAISYFVVATVHMIWAKPTDEAETKPWAKIRDVVLFWPEWLIMLSLVAIHTSITFLLNVPGCRAGYLGPGGMHMDGKYVNCTGGAAGYIDRLVLGDNHIYANPTSNEIYDAHMPYDPEGILGSLTSIFLTFLGLQAGKILLTYQHAKHRIIRWMGWSLLCGMIGGLLCGFSKEDGVIPVNKNLWSLSFILSLAGLAFALLTALFILIDLLRLTSGAPVIYLGMNSILVYVGHSICGSMLPWSWAGPENHWRYMAMNLIATHIWVIIAFVLHRKKIYLAL